MKYIYAALLLHTSDKKVDEESIKKVITSTGGVADEAMVKALVASLSEVDIDQAIKAAPGITVAAPTQEVKAPTPEKKEVKKEEKKEGGEAIAGLGALFG